MQYIVLAICGAHFTLWLGGKFAKDATKLKIKVKKEEYERYIDPKSDDKQGLMNYEGGLLFKWSVLIV